MGDQPNRETDNRPRFGINLPIENPVNQSSTFQEPSILGFQTGNVFSTSFLGIRDDYQDKSGFSDAPLLRYINEMLMEEDIEDQTHMLQESLDFRAKEQSFYEVIGKKYPPSPQPGRFSSNTESPDDNDPCPNPYSSSSSSYDGSGYLIDIVNPSWINKPNSLVRFDSSSNVSKSVTPSNEVSTFLPSENNLSVNVDVNDFLAQDPRCEYDSRSNKRNHHIVEMDMEERSSKLPALNTDFDPLVGEFDAMLLNSMGEGRDKFGAYREDLKNTLYENKHRTKGKRSRVKFQNKKKEVIDLRTLLIDCAKEVAADDSRSANELLKKIRQHSSPCGDANQRLSHYLSDALEARLAGSGSLIYKSVVNRRTKAADYLRAYYTSLASAPFKKISNLATIRTIINKSRKSTKIHVIDFGILYGFQWPTFIQRISKREDGPPKVKITGIDFPQPGFRPAERIEDTGRRLARYAEKFDVPFEYNAIAKKWETIKIEDLKIEDDEFLVVTCMYRSKNLPDETGEAHSSRTLVLNLIKNINPDYFIHGVVNGNYSAPFFLTRFREILYHFSALFDMLEASVPRETPERMLIEKEIFAREAFNGIACEGCERVERPETYKQWQVRNMKAGFVQVSFDREIIREAIEKVKMYFHKDFLIDEHGKWIMLGWRGRIIDAISCWKPVKEK